MIQRTLPVWGLLAIVCLGGCVAVPEPGSPEACAFVAEAFVPVSMQRNVPLVTVSIDGNPATLVLDTGAEWSLLSEQAGKRLELQTDWSRLGTAHGIGGQVVHYGLVIDRFDLGGLQLRNQSIGVGIVNWGDGMVKPDGYLGENVLSHYDVDIDLAHGRMTLYRARNCPQGGPPWTGPYRTANIQYASREHNLPSMAIQLDGKPLDATIDTGAEFSVVAARTASETLGIDQATLDQDRRGKAYGAGPSTVTSRLHAFSEAQIMGERSEKPRLFVVDLPPFAGDMLLGVDYWRSHRIYLSYATGHMFVARSGRKQATASTAP